MCALVTDEFVEFFYDDVKYHVAFALCAREIFSGECVDRYLFHTEFPAPVKDALCGSCAVQMPVISQDTDPIGVSAVPVHYDGDVAGYVVLPDFLGQ